MRTLLAPGSGDGTPLHLRAGSCSARGVARVLFARIEPARAEGKYPRGSFDDEGYGLHIAYSIPAKDAVPHFDYPGVKELPQSNEMEVRFGPGTHWLNYPGECRLVGGKGLWLVDVQVIEVDRTNPHWHWLLRRLPRSGSFATSPHHSLVGSADSAARMRAWDGSTMRVSSPAVPVMGALSVRSTGSASATVLTYSGWYG